MTQKINIIDFKQLQIRSEIGKGGQGVVELAVWNEVTKVAVKHLHRNNLDDMKIEECLNEISVMNNLNYPQIVR